MVDHQHSTLGAFSALSVRGRRDYGLDELRRYAPDLNHDLDTAAAR